MSVRNNLESRLIVPPASLAEFLQTDEVLDPLELMSLLWSRLYRSGSVRYPSGERATRRRRRDRERAKNRRHRRVAR